MLIVILAALGAPLALVAVGAAGVLGLGLITRPRAATLLFVGLLYANVPVVAAGFHGVPEVLAVGGPLLLLGVPIVAYLVIRRQELVVTPTLVWLVAYLAVQVLAALFSADAEASASFVATFASEGLLLYVLLTNAVRDWGTLRAAVVVLLAVGAVLGGLSIFQDVTDTYGNQYLGFAQTAGVDPLETVEADSDRQARRSHRRGESLRPDHAHPAPARAHGLPHGTVASNSTSWLPARAWQSWQGRC